MYDEKIEKLIELKINGAFDSYEVLSNEFRIGEHELRKLGKTLKEIIINFLEVPIEKYNEFEQVSKELKKAKNRYNNKKHVGFKTKDEFVRWFISQPKNCCYCGVSERLLVEYFEQSSSKRSNRGKSLEIERILTSGDDNIYSKENCSLACYICNNAKSDLIHYKDFKPIALGIHNFWKNKFPNEEINFPEEFYNKKIQINRK